MSAAWRSVAGARVALVALAVAACEPGTDASSATQGPHDCPACECVCTCEGGAPQASPADADTPANSPGDPEHVEPPVAGTPTTPVGIASDQRAVGDLIAAANRKMMHDDGIGCLADLDAAAVLDPAMDARMAVTRGQCEMLVGKCRDGKARVAKWYEVETAMLPDRAAQMAESIASMRCREGDSTDRDRLLRASFELTDAAYVNKRSAKYCRERVDLIRELLPKVPPRDVDDTQISGMGQALFHTGAACFARAGDCKAAYATYDALYPKQHFPPELDAAARSKVIRDSFESGIERCKP